MGKLDLTLFASFWTYVY